MRFDKEHLPHKRQRKEALFWWHLPPLFEAFAANEFLGPSSEAQQPFLDPTHKQSPKMQTLKIFIEEIVEQKQICIL